MTRARGIVIAIGAWVLVAAAAAGQTGERLEFQIVPDETDGPPDGAVVKLSRPTREGVAPPPTGKVVGRKIVVEGVAADCEDILATAPDGTMADLPFSREDGKTRTGWAEFKKPRSLVLTVRDKAGVPLAGYRAQSRSMRTEWKFINCTMSEPIPYDPVGPIVTLDAAGSARIEGLPHDAWFVAVWKAGAPEPLHAIAGSIDLTPPGEKRLDAVVERARRCVVHVTVDGQKKLPPRVSVKDLFEPIGPIEENAAEGTLRFEIRPDKGDTSVELTILGAGGLERDLDLDLPADPTVVLEGRVDLRSGGDLPSGGELRVRVRPPDRAPDVVLETRRHFCWGPIEGVPLVRERLSDGWAFRLLPPGFYHVRDTVTGAVTRDVIIHGGRTADLTIDLEKR